MSARSCFGVGVLVGELLMVGMAVGFHALASKVLGRKVPIL